MRHHYSINEAVALLKKSNALVTTIENEKMSVEHHAPHVTDGQIPHKKDELYIIASGNAALYEIKK